MRKGHCFLVRLIAVFGVTFLWSTQALSLGYFASAGAGMPPFGIETVALSGSGSGSDMVQFKAGGHVLGFQPRKVYFASLDHGLSVEFLGTAGVMPKAGVEGRERGNKSKVPNPGKVVYEGLWQDISLTYESKEGGIVESTYRIGPGADVSKIRLRYNVAVEVQRDGSLKFKFERGYLTETSPVAWQEIGGERVPVEVAFRVTGGEVGFRVGQYDPSYPLTIDPAYAWHTFYGSGSSFDSGRSIAIDSSGNIYVTGYSTAPWNGPAGEPPLHAHSGGAELFVMKLDSSGAYQWHTFYGEAASDYGQGIAIDGSGNVYVTGYSEATWNGPAGENPLNVFSGNKKDIFVLKLNMGGAYQWHTFYGGPYTRGVPSGDYALAIAADSSGNVYITGYSTAPWNGPTGENPLHAHNGLYYYDIFVLKLNMGGTYQWHTFYGSRSIGMRGIDSANGIAVDGSGNVYVTGWSYGPWNGPTGENPLHGYSGGMYEDIFVLKLDSSGAYQWHTFYGSGTWDYGLSIAVDGSGNVYVTGYSWGTWNGPAGENPLHAYSGISGSYNTDIFVLKLDSSGTYQWHTFYGSSDEDVGYAIAVDGSGNVYVTGYSNAIWNGPTGQNPLQPYSGGAELFVLKLDSSGAYQWHTFYGSSNTDVGFGIAVDGNGNVYVTGYSYAWNGPAGENPLHAYSGGRDVFVLKLSQIPHVVAQSPSIDALGVPLNIVITAIFSEEMDPITINTNTFTLSFGTQPVPGTVSYDPGTRKATFASNDILGYNTRYTANISTGVKDLAGYPMAADYSWSFTTIREPGQPKANCDFNNDGKPDILWRERKTGENAVWFMDGITWTGYAFLPAVATSWNIVGTADFNGDGKPDILWRNWMSGENAVWFMDGVSYTGYVFLPAVASSWDIVGTADFNGDGKPDILWRNGFTGENAVWFMDGVSWTGYVFLPPVASSWKIVGTADFNGDGKPDILWRNGFTGENAVWFMDGVTCTGYVFLPPVASSWKIVGTADFNGDGETDILWRNGFTGENAVWFMDGVTCTGYAYLPAVATSWDIVGP